MGKQCPYCGREMASGYVQCRDGVFWCEKKRAVAAIPPLFQHSVRLAPSSGPFDGGAAEAYHCTACQKIVIDYAGVE